MRLWILPSSTAKKTEDEEEEWKEKRLINKSAKTTDNFLKARGREINKNTGNVGKKLNSLSKKFKIKQQEDTFS